MGLACVDCGDFTIDPNRFRCPCCEAADAIRIAEYLARNPPTPGYLSPDQREANGLGLRVGVVGRFR